MILFLLAYLGGVLTIVSPCILPVLPFVFARADQPFLPSGLPMLVGMTAAFAAVATLAAVAGGWAVEANELGRLAALALLAVFASWRYPEGNEGTARSPIAARTNLFGSERTFRGASSSSPDRAERERKVGSHRRP